MRPRVDVEGRPCTDRARSDMLVRRRRARPAHSHVIRRLDPGAHVVVDMQTTRRRHRSVLAAHRARRQSSGCVRAADNVSCCSRRRSDWSLPARRAASAAFGNSLPDLGVECGLEELGRGRPGALFSCVHRAHIAHHRHAWRAVDPTARDTVAQRVIFAAIWLAALADACGTLFMALSPAAMTWQPCWLSAITAACSSLLRGGEGDWGHGVR